MLTTKYQAPRVEALTDEEYFGAYKEYVTAHKLITYSRDPVGFFDAKEEDVPNDNLVFGGAVHKFCLEGERAFWDTYAVVEDSEATTKGGRFVGRGSKQWDTLCKGLGLPKDRVIRDSEFAKIQSIADAFLSSRSAIWVHDSKVEQTLRWQMFGLNCQGKADMLCNKSHVIIDLKTSSNVGGFEGAALRYGYDIQAAFYERGYDYVFGFKPKFIFVVIEKEPPHPIREVQLDFFTMEQARRDMEHWISRLYDDLKARSEG